MGGLLKMCDGLGLCISDQQFVLPQTHAVQGLVPAPGAAQGHWGQSATPLGSPKCKEQEASPSSTGELR